MRNKIALVTGGSRGLGKNMALRLAQGGHDVVITYHTKIDEANEVVKSIEKLGQKAIAIQLDVNDIPSLTNFVGQFYKILNDKWQVLNFDFLINNAGIGATIPFLEATEEDFDKMMNIHFKSVYFLTQKLFPLINENGRIINISSGTTRFCNPGYSIYASMKGAIEIFTRYIAKEGSTKKITANVVAPGPIETDFNNAFIRNNEQVKTHLGNMTALGRVGNANDIGGIIVFLCSEDGYWINGQRIEASGGINL
jgi:NAD(P)-dependent dehydrogenase (short-subunit alcohol dehydrogenase family)